MQAIRQQLHASALPDDATGSPQTNGPDIARATPFTSSVTAGRAYASSASSTFPFVSIPTKCTVTAAISGTMPIK